MATKSRLIFLSADGILSPWQELGLEPNAAFQVSGFPLIRAHEFQNTDEKIATLAFLLDLEDLAQTKPLDQWALNAWKNTFNEIFARSPQPNGKAALLIAYTREPSWEKAQLALRIGARDLVKLSQLNERLEEIFLGGKDSSDNADLKEEILPNNVVSLFDRQKKTLAPYPKAAGPLIPKHAIPFPVEGLEGSSSAIEAVRNLVRKSAPLDTSVLISGATGSGKELVARCIHRYGSRANGSFIAVNCGAINPGLAEAEFFGHSEGAFTGAVGARVGFLEAANGGSLFLDEVSELSLDLQVKLLRVLQERQITPVGSSKSIPLDIRVIAASKENLEELCEAGRFRKDLLYRLRVIEIPLPSLLERKGDIAELSRTVLRKLAKRHKRPVLQLSEQALEKFLLYRWPGNVRELENTLEHGATLAWAEGRKELELKDFPENIQFASMQSGSEYDLKEIVRRFEREYIASTIRRLGGSKEQAAEVLGLSLATLYRKLGNAG